MIYKLIFTIFVFLVSFGVRAEISPASTIYHYGTPSDASSSYLVACQNQANRWFQGQGSPAGYTMQSSIVNTNNCRVTRVTTEYLPNSWAYTIIYSSLTPNDLLGCQSGQNWTLSGSNCTRPDCVAPDVRDPATGVCGAPPTCPTSGTAISTGQFKYAGSGSFCAPNGCTAMFQGTWPTGKDATGALYGTGSIIYIGDGTKGECTPSPLPSAEAAPKPTTDAPCAPGEGVMTSTSGKVACVPPGTPGSDNPPKVTKTSATKNFPDGSTQVTTTTQTCTGAGACSSTTQITNTGPTGSPSTTGDAGKPGTTSEVKEKQPSESSSFCQQNPGLQMCKGGMNEEATQKEVRDLVKGLTDPGATPYDQVTNATNSESSQNALDSENAKFTSAANGTVDVTAGNKSSWASAMEAGWFSPIPASGCSPVGGTIGGRSFSIDICPTAAKVSTIVEYAMWFALVVGFFVMFTGGRQT